MKKIIAVIYSLTLLSGCSSTAPVTVQRQIGSTTSGSVESDRRVEVPKVTHELICPSSAAEKAQEFRMASSAYVKAVQKSLNTRNGDLATWSYIKVQAQDVDGLTEDGKRDKQNPNKAFLILGSTHNSINVDATFLTYSYGDPNKELRFLNTPMRVEARAESLPLENDDLRKFGMPPGYLPGQDYSKYGYPQSVPSYQHHSSEISATADLFRRIGASTFVIVEGSEGEIPEKDFVITNTIFIDSSDMPKRNDFRRLQLINQQLYFSLPEEDLHNFEGANTLFLTSVRNSNSEELVTIYDQVTSEKPLVAHTFNLGRDRNASNSRFTNFLISRLKGLSSGARMYWYGDHVSSVNIPQIAYRSSADLIRRPITINKNFTSTDRKLLGTYQLKFNPESTILSDGIPSTETDLEAMGRPLNEIGKWLQHKENVHNIVKGRYSRIITTKADFIHELQYGDSDEIMLFAHSDGNHIYFGSESVSKEEIASLPRREEATERTRAAVVISCGFGDLSEGRNNWLLWKEPKSFAELLVEKNFFDFVIAPDHPVKQSEAVNVLSTILRDGTMWHIHKAHRGWHKIATLNPLLTSPENKYEISSLLSQARICFWGCSG